MVTVASDNPFPSVLLVEGDPEALAANPAAGQWRLAVGPGGIFYAVDETGTATPIGAVPDAEDVPVTPFGTIGATNVQDALEEIVAEAAGFSDPMTTRGDLMYRNASNVTDRLGRGANPSILGSDGTDVAWVRPAVPAIIQAANGAASTTSLGVTIAAAAAGSRLIVCIGSNARDVNTPTCTNVTFTKVGNANFSTTIYTNIYVGVVAGGASGTTVTITATGSNFIEADVYEIPDALTPTVSGTQQTSTNTSAAAVVGSNLASVSPARGTLCICAAAEDNGTVALILEAGVPFRKRGVQAGTCTSLIFYAPGGPCPVWIRAGTTGGDFALTLVAVT